jgi:integrase
VAYVERSTGPLVLGLPKSRAGRRVVGIPAAIVPDLERHVAVYVKPEPGAFVFPGIMGGPVRRGNFNKLSGWPHAVEALGMPGLHFHDVRHSYATAGRNAKINWKALSKRIGHADVAFTIGSTCRPTWKPTGKWRTPWPTLILGGLLITDDLRDHG